MAKNRRSNIVDRWTKIGNGRKRGFIKALVVIVLGVCALFIVMAVLVKFIGPKSFVSLNTLVPKTSQTSTTRPNSLINFGSNSGGASKPGLESGQSGSNENELPAGVSPFTNKVHLTKGNTSTAQPHEEYVVIKNAGVPVDITGWKLENGKGARPVQNSQNSYFYPTPDVAYIGVGTEFLDPAGSYLAGPIVLKTGDTAYVITGGPFTQYSFPLSVSFRENMCTGYLKVYPFSPSLTKSCPYAKNDPAVNSVTEECYKYLTRINRCEDPQKEDTERFNELPSHCKDFIVSRFNYPKCVAINRYAEGFGLNKWRIFLGKQREMWAARSETITLYDSLGRVVDKITY